MSKILRQSAAVLISILLVPLCVSAAGLSRGEMDTISIAPLNVQPSVTEMAEKKNRLTELKRISDSLETELIAALNATHVFQLVERKNMAATEPEQDDATAAGATDGRSETGAFKGARFALLPRIDGFEDTSVRTDYQAIGRASLNRKLFLSAVVQIVDTATGTLLPGSPSIQLTRSEEVENARIGQLSGSDEVIVALARDMAKKLSQEVASLLRPAKILMVSGKQLLINRGSEAGFSKGDLVEIYAVQDVKDEDTGEMFRNEVAVGQAVIGRIDKNQSYATISGDDQGITKGCVVRFVKTAAGRAAEWAPPPDATLPDFEKKGDGGTTPGSSEKPLKWK